MSGKKKISDNTTRSIESVSILKMARSKVSKSYALLVPKALATIVTLIFHSAHSEIKAIKSRQLISILVLSFRCAFDSHSLDFSSWICVDKSQKT